MRLWSLHPKYLDTKGLLAQWREGLLAKKVLEGKTKGYKNHPQLERFKNYSRPLDAINSFLTYTAEEAERRGYNFDKTKIKIIYLKNAITVTKGQIEYEFKHLTKKLEKRDRKKLEEIKNIKIIEPSPIFKIVKGNVEKWEVIQV
ncbi:MAG: pyrimidine dimer DNA glycosylase/endonuclease V [Candidatus Aenigmarchaeota archaeon]|nr:pyrimidine dimer DNA glycosylase/endonuclease V [Candidatus Aenigmarchaeota archaeon]MBU5688667.1 pyrimidine dimer DNA glycosylase/endonuclease V [Candidatus Aenigmarchaeota archaeon]